MVHKILNASNILGASAFLAMIAATGAIEERPVLSIILAVFFAVCAHLSLKEDGKRR